MQKLMARQDNATRGKQAELLLVVKISGMTNWRRRCRQDIDSADGKCDGEAKMHCWNRVFRLYGQSVWHNDNDQHQHLRDKPTKSKVRDISPCHACGREHKVGDKSHYRQGTEEPVVYSRPIQKNKRQCQPGRHRPKQDVLQPLPVIGNKGKDQQNIKNCDHRHNCQQGGARKTHTGGVSRTVNELWHSRATLSVEKLERRMPASATRATVE